MISQSRLQELLHYDPTTGVFTWRVDKGARAKAAEKVCGYHENHGTVRDTEHIPFEEYKFVYTELPPAPSEAPTPEIPHSAIQHFMEH